MIHKYSSVVLRNLCALLALLFSGVAYGQAPQTFTSAAGGLIPDDGTTTYWPITVSGLTPANIDTANYGLEKVCINLTHTWDSDLELSLISPDGTEFLLFTGVGSDGDDFTNTCLGKNFPNPIGQGSAPFSGDYAPMGDMGLVNNGQDGNGVWQLKIRDTYAFADQGSVISWSVTFGPDPAVPFGVSSSNLPLVKIFTQGNQGIPDDPKIPAEIRIIDNGPGVRNYLNDTNYAFTHYIGIEVRGSSSGGVPKKSYGFETWDSLQMDKDTSFLGFPAQSDWILHANHIDKSLMRNPLSYELSNRMGHYASRCKYVEVFVNNQYMGVYTLMEKIKRDSARVDIANLSPTDTAGDDVTGGYIIKIDKITGGGGGGWYSNFSQPNDINFYTYFQYDYPNDAEIKPEQADYIRAFVDSFEIALKGNNFQDPQTGWRKYAGEKSFIDYLFLNEVSKNVDGYRISTYLYKEKVTDGNKLKIGPAWDYDIAWYNADYCEATLDTGWAYNFNYVCGAGVPFWWERMMEDTMFRAHAACRWTELRAEGGALNTDSIMAYIDSIASQINEGQERNFTMWPVLGVYTWPEPAPLSPTYAGQVNKLKLWVNNRMVWLDAQFNAMQPTPILASLGNDTAFCEGNSISITPGLFTDYDWSTGQTSPVITVSQTGLYTVTVENKYWCKSNDDIAVYAIPLPSSSFYTDSVGHFTIGFTADDDNGASYLWYFGDGDSSTAVNPTHQYDTIGNYTISLTIVDSAGCSSSSSSTITIAFPVGLNDEITSAILQVYPNPAANDLMVNYTAANYTLQIENMMGQAVYTSANNNRLTHVDVSALSTGFYLLRIVENGRTTATHKFTKQ